LVWLQQRFRVLCQLIHFFIHSILFIIVSVISGDAIDDITDNIHEDEVDMVLFASNLMDMGDFLRCAYYLRKIHKTNGTYLSTHYYYWL